MGEVSSRGQKVVVNERSVGRSQSLHRNCANKLLVQELSE
jgi:hypothetical protein